MLLNRTLCLCREIKSHNETTETQWNGIDLSHLPVDFRSHAGPVQYVQFLGQNGLSWNVVPLAMNLIRHSIVQDQPQQASKTFWEVFHFQILRLKDGRGDGAD